MPWPAAARCHRARKRREIVEPSLERRNASALARGKIAARDLALAHHGISEDRIGEALQGKGRERLALEEVSDQLARRVRDDHRAGVRHRLEPRREIGRLAEQPGFAQVPDAVELADDHGSGSGADAAAQQPVGNCLDRFDDA